MKLGRVVRWSALAVTALLVTAPVVRAEEKDIVETAIAAGKFKTLAKAVTEAGLVETLKGEGPFTVFAPTDEAFGKIPEETLTKLIGDKEQLKKVLTYHVVKGSVKAGDVVKLTEAETVNGKKFRIKVDGDTVYINDKIKVIKTDIVCKNGVIHVIDAVMLPPADEAAPAPAPAAASDK